MAASELTKHDGETQTQFAIRAVQHAAYQKAHDNFCDYGEGEHPQYHPVNPYSNPQEAPRGNA